MQLALIGYGRMGRALETAAAEAGHVIIARIDPAAAGADFAAIDAPALAGAEVCLEFSTPQSAFENCRQLLALGKPVVCGTTGWSAGLVELAARVEREGGALLHAPNFSLGMNLFFRLAAAAAQLADRFAEFEPYIFETHHSGKADSPSGTALKLGEVLLRNIARKHRLVLERLERPIAPDEISVGAARAGGQPGTHTVGFEGACESITLTHANRDRASLARGALLAAQWLRGRAGFYTFEQMIDEQLTVSSEF